MECEYKIPPQGGNKSCRAKDVADFWNTWPACFIGTPYWDSGFVESGEHCESTQVIGLHEYIIGECIRNKCNPTHSWSNGTECKFYRDCWGWSIWGAYCSTHVCTGKWDAGNKACVRCSGNKKNAVYSDKNSSYFTCPDSNYCGNCNCNTTNASNIKIVDPPQCELGCNTAIDSRCDDKAVGSVCFTEWETDPQNHCREREKIYKCDSNCRCIFSNYGNYRNKPNGTSCGDPYCSGTIRFYNGFCQDGNCTFSQEDCSSYGPCTICSPTGCILNSSPSVSSVESEEITCAWYTSPQICPSFAVRLKWNYFDPESNPQQSFEIWLDEDQSRLLSNPRFRFQGNTASQSYMLDLSQNQATNSEAYKYPLSWNKTYYWIVKVKDSCNNWSNWSGIGNFTTPLHEYPAVDFSWYPTKPTILEVVKFFDNSEVYGGTTKMFWYWNFEGGNPSSSTIQNPTSTFSTLGPKTVSLKVTDSSNYSCEKSKTLSISFPLPKWKEIPAAIYFYARRFLDLVFNPSQ